MHQLPLTSGIPRRSSKMSVPCAILSDRARIVAQIVRFSRFCRVSIVELNCSLSGSSISDHDCIFFSRIKISLRLLSLYLYCLIAAVSLSTAII